MGAWCDSVVDDGMTGTDTAGRGSINDLAGTGARYDCMCGVGKTVGGAARPNLFGQHGGGGGVGGMLVGRREDHGARSPTAFLNCSMTVHSGRYVCKHQGERCGRCT